MLVIVVHKPFFFSFSTALRMCGLVKDQWIRQMCMKFGANGVRSLTAGGRQGQSRGRGKGGIHTGLLIYMHKYDSDERNTP